MTLLWLTLGVLIREHGGSEPSSNCGDLKVRVWVLFQFLEGNVHKVNSTLLKPWNWRFVQWNAPRYAWFSSCCYCPPPPLAHCRDFAVFFLFYVLFPTQGHAERDSSLNIDWNKLFHGLDCRIPRNSSCSAQPPKMATPSEQALGTKRSVTTGNEWFSGGFAITRSPSIS